MMKNFENKKCWKCGKLPKNIYWLYIPVGEKVEKPRDNIKIITKVYIEINGLCVSCRNDLSQIRDEAVKRLVDSRMAVMISELQRDGEPKKIWSDWLDKITRK